MIFRQEEVEASKQTYDKENYQRIGEREEKPGQEVLQMSMLFYGGLSVTDSPRCFAELSLVLGFFLPLIRKIA